VTGDGEAAVECKVESAVASPRSLLCVCKVIAKSKKFIESYNYFLESGHAMQRRGDTPVLRASETDFADTD
jgi:hypothetical protein